MSIITSAVGATLANAAGRGNLKALRDLLNQVVDLVAGLTEGTATASKALVTSATNTVTGLLSLSATTLIGNLRLTRNSPVAAAGTNLATAGQLSNGFTVVTAADGTKGVALPSTPTAGDIVIIKGTANAVLKVYPDAAATINAIGSNGAISLASGLIPAIFIADSATQWYTIPLLPS